MHADDRPSHKRRWYQYSLRSLFLLTAVLAAWLGYVCDNARKQRKAVEVFTDLDALIRYDDEMLEENSFFAFNMGTLYLAATGRDFYTYVDAEPAGPKWLRDGIGEDYFRSVVAVSLSEQTDSRWPTATAENFHYVTLLPHLNRLCLDDIESLTDDDLTPLRQLKQLERLFMSGTQITDRGIRHLSGLKKLQYLSLASTNISDRGLIHLQGMTKLEMLELSDTNITDTGLEHLRALRGLRFLYLDGTKVTEEGVKRLEAALPNCSVSMYSPGTVG